MHPASNDADRVEAEPGLSPFGLDDPDEAWFDRLRRAARAPLLGVLGDYELLVEVNRGAQGVVYRARRLGESVDVAIKRLLAGSFATANARLRFERELEAVAALQHENIVRAVDLGASDQHPVLVMEWIDGIPVDRWSDQTKSQTPRVIATLEVFLQICHAVHYAHQRGVIHRDLKPSNILVDSMARPHVLDFGLAKIVYSQFDLATTVTGSSDFLGTPAYAAPEQVRCDHASIDVRTDVYALGVILYRMLTGTVPFMSTRGIADLLASIQNAEAKRPSRLDGSLNDNIDAIVGKAMAKNPEWRYASVDAFATDVQHYLSGEPIEAQRGRRWNELRKSMRRHRAAVGVLLTILLIVTGAGVVLWRMYARQGLMLAEVTIARDAELRARETIQRHQRVLEELLAAAAGIGKGTDLEIRRAWLDQATRVVAADLQGDPRAQASAHEAIGQTYQNLALYPEAEAHLRQAIELRRGFHPPDEVEEARSLQKLGELLLDYNRFSEAEPLLREALNMRQRLHAEDHVDVAESLNTVGLILQDRREYAAALEMHQLSLRMLRRLFGDHHPEIGRTLNLIGTLFLNEFQFSTAEFTFRDALNVNRSQFGEDHREVAGTKVNLGKALFQLGAFAEAEPYFLDAIDTYRRLLGDAHDNVAWGLHRLGVLLHAKGDYAGAESAMRESLAIYRRCFGDEDHYVAIVLNSLGTLLMDRGDLSGARGAFDEALAIDNGTRNSDHPTFVWNRNRLAEWLERAGNHEEAERMLRQVLSVRDQTLGVDFHNAARCMNSLARLLAARGEFMNAEAIFREVLECRQSRLGPQHPDVGQSLVNLASVLSAEGRNTEADDLVEQGIALQRSALGNDHPELALSLTIGAEIAEKCGDSQRADDMRRQIVDLCKRVDCLDISFSP